MPVIFLAGTSGAVGWYEWGLSTTERVENEKKVEKEVDKYYLIIVIVKMVDSKYEFFVFWSPLAKVSEEHVVTFYLPFFLF
jgi:hypothetical protein